MSHIQAGYAIAPLESTMGREKTTVSLCSSVNWANVGQRLVSRVCVASFIAGMATVWAIDSYFRNMESIAFEASQVSAPDNDPYAGFGKEGSPVEKCLKRHQRIISCIIYGVVLCTGITALVIRSITGVFDAQRHLFLLCAGGCFALGAQAKRYYNKNSTYKIREFAQHIRGDYEGRVFFSKYCEYLRHLNLTKLKEELQCPDSRLVLRRCGLMDQDVMRLAEAGWFDHFTTIDVSQNPQLTCEAFSWIEKINPWEELSLDLSGSDLSDQDLLKMSNSGYFTNLHTLIIKNNPSVTGRGLAQIARAGFSGLRFLDIGQNSQLLGDGLNQWIQEEGFKTLTALGLSNIGLTRSHLEEMINLSPWFKNLAGLDVSHNAELYEFPANISELQHLDAIGVHRDFRGSGLFITIRNCRKITEELKVLLGQHKVQPYAFQTF